MKMIISKIINLLAFNVLGASVTAWLVTFWNTYTLALAVLTGTSLLIINIMKIRGMWIDQKLKMKELNKK